MGPIDWEHVRPVAYSASSSRLGLRRGVDPPSRGLAGEWAIFSRRPCFPCCQRNTSSRVPWLQRHVPAFLASTDPSATLSSSAHFPGALVIGRTWLPQFRGGTRRASPVAQRVLVPVLSLPPRRSVPSRQPACGGPCGLRPFIAGPASGASRCRGHLCVPLRYGPGTRWPSRRWRCRWAFRVGFPAP